MKVSNKIELEFAGVTLPVVKDEEGRDVVPLKPISDVFGIRWEDQRLKVQRGYLAKFLGTCTPDIRGADQLREMVCIRLDRVAAWMFQINPERVRAAGNEAGADFLIAKHEEWADLIHQYETCKGGMLAHESAARTANLRLFIQAIRTRQRVESKSDRAALWHVVGQLAADLDVPYQPELPGTE